MRFDFNDHVYIDISDTTESNHRHQGVVCRE